MITIKKQPAEVSIGLGSNVNKGNKFFNQMNFKGIEEDNNLFAIDQESFTDCKNVYVDTDNHFVSRDSLQYDPDLPSAIKANLELNGKLVEVLNFGKVDIYVTSHYNEGAQTDYYDIISSLDNNFATVAGNITKYHLCSIDNYIICFNNVYAQVLDINGYTTEGSEIIPPYWQNLKNYAEVPIIKRVVGGVIETYEKNIFTKKYKEQYIWSNDSTPALPEESTIANIKIKTSYGSTEYTLDNVYQDTEFRLIREANVQLQNSDIVTMNKNTICIAKNDRVLISYNAGTTFSTIYYPAYEGVFLNIASISKDGFNFFFVTSYGVYRYNLTNGLWGDVIRVTNNTVTPNVEENILYTGWQNQCCFLDDQNFCFVTYEPSEDEDTNKLRLYWKGKGLYNGTDYTKDNVLWYTEISSINGGAYEYMDMLEQVNNHSLSMSLLNANSYGSDPAQETCAIVLLLYNTHDHSTYAYYIRGGKTTSQQGSEASNEMYSHMRKLSVTNQEIVLSIGQGESIQYWPNGSNAMPLSSRFKITMAEFVQDTPATLTQYEGYLYCGIYYPPATPSIRVKDMAIALTKEYSNEQQSLAPISLLDSGVIEYHNGNYIKINGHNILNDTIQPSIYNIYVNGNYFYLVSLTKIYTNILNNNDLAEITYTYSPSGDTFKDVPSLSYSDTELYLAFDNLLRITDNTKDDNGNLLLNLPAKYDQPFVDNITGLINISTTEIAIFFKDTVKILQKADDETLGTVYRLLNTKLSTGIRPGDNVINTLEGSYTIFPTNRGLAVMSYQAFMATSDQVVEYVTDKVRKLWESFYYETSQMKIIQWRNILVFTNGSKNILLYDVAAQTWWRWEVPFNTLYAKTDQIHLRLICRDNLCIFTDKFNNKQLQYYDFSANGEYFEIDWFAKSQPLYMNAPTYYKNIKQLVFQFYDEELTDRTMQAQIRLYRKRLTTREPEVINFKVDRLRTFVKRFNYWKINELQWALGSDNHNKNPKQLRMNAISVKYEIGEEVR